ncbi:MAG TPA: hypothetical protein VFM85_05955 [Actinomycetota bacterium]|nr:hypothetical protein [Actinomycetota bacterium]
MKTTHRCLLFLWIVIAATLAASCTRSTAREPRATGTIGSGAGTGNVTPEGTATGPPGTAVYRYANPGLLATMSLDGDSGTLTIENDTGAELPPPGFYILDARTGDRVGGEVKDPTVIPNGEMKTYRVSFSGLGIKDIGLVILVIGHDNYGAFTRK